MKKTEECYVCLSDVSGGAYVDQLDEDLDKVIFVCQECWADYEIDTYGYREEDEEEE